jgi:hypothetical protein
MQSWRNYQQAWNLVYIEIHIKIRYHAWIQDLSILKKTHTGTADMHQHPQSHAYQRNLRKIKLKKCKTLKIERQTSADLVTSWPQRTFFKFQPLIDKANRSLHSQRPTAPHRSLLPLIITDKLEEMMEIFRFCINLGINQLAEQIEEPN